MYHVLCCHVKKPDMVSQHNIWGGPGAKYKYTVKPAQCASGGGGGGEDFPHDSLQISKNALHINS